MIRILTEIILSSSDIMKTAFQQGKGRFNKEYWTCLFHFEEKDSHFFLRKEKSKCNYMPKHSEICMMISACLEVEPQDKRDKLKKLFIESIEEGSKKPHIYN